MARGGRLALAALEMPGQWWKAIQTLAVDINQYLLSQTEDVDTMRIYCWASVCDAGPALNLHCVSLGCLTPPGALRRSSCVHRKPNPLPPITTLIVLIPFLLTLE